MYFSPFIFVKLAKIKFFHHQTEYERMTFKVKEVVVQYSLIDKTYFHFLSDEQKESFPQKFELVNIVLNQICSSLPLDPNQPETPLQIQNAGGSPIVRNSL